MDKTVYRLRLRVNLEHSRIKECEIKTRLLEVFNDATKLSYHKVSKKDRCGNEDYRIDFAVDTPNDMLSGTIWYAHTTNNRIIIIETMID